MRKSFRKLNKSVAKIGSLSEISPPVSRRLTITKYQTPLQRSKKNYPQKVINNISQHQNFITCNIELKNTDSNEGHQEVNISFGTNSQPNAGANVSNFSIDYPNSGITKGYKSTLQYKESELQQITEDCKESEKSAMKNTSEEKNYIKVQNKPPISNFDLTKKTEKKKADEGSKSEAKYDKKAAFESKIPAVMHKTDSKHHSGILKKAQKENSRTQDIPNSNSTPSTFQNTNNYNTILNTNKQTARITLTTAPNTNNTNNANTRNNRNTEIIINNANTTTLTNPGKEKNAHLAAENTGNIREGNIEMPSTNRMKSKSVSSRNDEEYSPNRKIHTLHSHNPAFLSHAQSNLQSNLQTNPRSSQLSSAQQFDQSPLRVNKFQGQHVHPLDSANSIISFPKPSLFPAKKNSGGLHHELSMHDNHASSKRTSGCSDQDTSFDYKLANRGFSVSELQARFKNLRSGSLCDEIKPQHKLNAQTGILKTLESQGKSKFVLFIIFSNFSLALLF